MMEGSTASETVSYHETESRVEDREPKEDDFVLVTVLGIGRIFNYVIPSFPIFKTTLQEVKLQFEEPDGTVQVFNGFAKCGMLDERSLPALAKINFSFDNTFIIEVYEVHVGINNVYLTFVNTVVMKCCIVTEGGVWEVC